MKDKEERKEFLDKMYKERGLARHCRRCLIHHQQEKNRNKRYKCKECIL